MIELLIGIVFAAVILALPYLKDRIGGDLFTRFKIPLARRKEIEEKIKEVDKELEKVVELGVKKKDIGVTENSKPQEKVALLEDVAEIQIDDNLLEEMETASTIKTSMPDYSEERLPDIPELPELNSDLDMDFEDIGGEIKLEDAGEEEEIEKVEFDEEDDLISSIAKVVEVKEEEEFDLLRDLKGKKFSAEELERELHETIQRLKALAGGR